MAWLTRAYVYPPDSVTRSSASRTVFFDVPTRDTNRGAYLVQLLATLWGVDAGELEGCVESIRDEFDLAHDSYGGNDLNRGDLCLLESGAGGSFGVGPKGIHYAAAGEVDLYVSPRHAQRIRAALQRVEFMRRQAERGDDPSAPQWTVGQARDEILAAELPERVSDWASRETLDREAKKLDAQGPILRVPMRRAGEAWPAEILVDGAQLAAATLAALKRLKGVEVIRRARPAPKPEDGCARGHDLVEIDRGPTWTLGRCSRCGEEVRQFYD
jgi:hypothetical protein